MSSKIYALKAILPGNGNCGYIIKIYYVDDFNNLYAVFDQYEKKLNNEKDNWDFCYEVETIEELRKCWNSNINWLKCLKWGVEREQEYEKLDPNIFKRLIEELPLNE